MTGNTRFSATEITGIPSQEFSDACGLPPLATRSADVVSSV